MEPNERIEMEKALKEALQKVISKPYIASVCILDYEARTPEEKNQNEAFLIFSQPLDQMPFKKAKILIEGLGGMMQQFMNSVSINFQSVVMTAPPSQKQSKELQYG